MRRSAVVVALLWIATDTCAALSQNAEPSGSRSRFAQFIYGAAEFIGREAAAGAVQWGAGRLLDELFPRDSAGNVNTQEFRRALQRLAESDQQNAAAIRDLQAGLRDRMTSAEVHALLHQSLTKVDKKLADQARQIQEQRETLYRHQRALMQFEQDIDVLFKGQKKLGDKIDDVRTDLTGKIKKTREELSGKIEGLRTEVGQELTYQDARTDRVESDMEALRRDYPRWTPGEQGEQLGISGFQMIQKGELREAIRALRYAHAYDPGEPCYLYWLAVALRRDGKSDDAELYLARGVAAERKRPLTYSRAWKNTWERFQGSDRAWVENARADAIYGVFIPGTIQVPGGSTKR